MALKDYTGCAYCSRQTRITDSPEYRGELFCDRGCIKRFENDRLKTERNLEDSEPVSVCNICGDTFTVEAGSGRVYAKYDTILCSGVCKQHYHRMMMKQDATA